MINCKICNDEKVLFYYGEVCICADCSDELKLGKYIKDLKEQLKQTQEENKKLREVVELILESKPVEDILKDKNSMFSWNMGLIVKARSVLKELNNE